MKRFLGCILVAVLFLGCDSEDGLNCFQAAGDIVQEEFEVLPFERILVRERVQLILKEGPFQKVVVETGENLLNDIVVESRNNLLSVKNDNGCNLVRDYGITKVFVTSPNISEIRNSSGLAVLSDGTLTYPELTLISEDQDNEDEFHIDGDFRIQFEGGILNIASSGISNYYLSGTAEEANFNLFDGDARVEAENLLIEDLNIFHRSTQKMIVYPINSIQGEIRSLGDVIAKNRPVIVSVEEFYTGRLIIED
ncbi:DUF2807 domain-containing protein [Aureisphaera galaxeae]|uniref:head GIN domain-containing protein n=1 Tax=Aureisphaera galaxeae TaxID=1538023 RepID=UPI0023505899|nr:head GIN domain-containing protein [Aureisphaera galaxeae]MDC8003163.1 DUF2807 domain-containing protein [Aureisphaera galaxeae]